MKDGIRTGQSFITYVNPSPLQSQRAAQTGSLGTPAPEIAPPLPRAEDAPKTRAGADILAAVRRGVSNGALSGPEVKVVLDKVAKVRTAAELADAYAAITDAVSNTLMPLDTRVRLQAALLERAGAVEGGHAVVSPALTEAVGEDVFGMGALPLGPVATQAHRAATNEVITTYETNELVAALGDVQDRWELFGALAALRKVVGGNAITRENRRALADAYLAASDRIGDGFPAMTRAMNEDIFGIGPSSSALDLLAKGKRDGAFESFEVQQVVHEIDKIQSKDELRDVFVAASKAIGRTVDGDAIIKPKDRTKLAHALSAANWRLGGDAVPVMVTLAVGEDIFGMGNQPLIGTEKAVLRAVEDDVLSKNNTDAILEALSAVNDKADFERAHAAIRQAASLNLLTLDDRHRLARAVGDKSVELEAFLAVTRAMNEDVLGMHPTV